MDEQPPNIYRFPSGKIRREEWRTTVNGKSILHRNNDNPAVILYYASGIKRKEIWYTRNEITRCGPVDKILRSMYSIEINRPSNFPAKIEYYDKTGSISVKKWYYYNMSHGKDNSPAIIKYENTSDGTLGRIIFKEWRWLGDIYRNDGPAVMKESIKGDLKLFFYNDNHERVTMYEWLKMLTSTEIKKWVSSDEFNCWSGMSLEEKIQLKMIHI